MKKILAKKNTDYKELKKIDEIFEKAVRSVNSILKKNNPALKFRS